MRRALGFCVIEAEDLMMRTLEGIPAEVVRPLLDEAVELFEEFQVDSIVAIDERKPRGALDIQDLVKLGLLGQERL